ncbi:hypothetical protein [Biformimicrobium ophioploci]|uniref:Uncharacterized protein n=1 Tax=Biformimicrobium ophioploci TaxID=3036711 RepID=A0ABQ6LYE6_9GAMM|nr:hypothetical protein [Microbulbifer sp. NKW57]GMG87129.1 hypothetical protein MNKW57_14500 [Microbulbifer sp. NKW57]
MSRSIHVTKKKALASLNDGDIEEVKQFRLKKIIKSEYPKYRKSKGKWTDKKDVAPTSASYEGAVKKVLD